MFGPYLLTRTLSYRFQGQEAPVSIVSLTHSDFDDDSAAAAVAGGGAHGMPFVLNANRLNVALSRAQCLAIVVASPQLTQARADMENKLARPSAIWLSEGLSQCQITWLRLGLPGAAAGLGLSAAWAACWPYRPWSPRRRVRARSSGNGSSTFTAEWSRPAHRMRLGRKASLFST